MRWAVRVEVSRGRGPDREGWRGTDHIEAQSKSDARQKMKESLTQKYPGADIRILTLKEMK